MEIHKVTEDKDGENTWPGDDFTGVWEIYYRKPTGSRANLKFRGEYLNGKENGDHICYWQNGTLAQIGKCENGNCVGVWIDYDDQGRKALECVYDEKGEYLKKRFFLEDGSISREQIRNGLDNDEIHREFDSNREILFEGVYRKGEPYDGICRVRNWEPPKYGYYAKFKEGIEMEVITDF